MSLFLSLALSAPPTHAATPEQVDCAIRYSGGMAMMHTMGDTNWYFLTSHPATSAYPAYVEIYINQDGRYDSMVVLDYGLDGIVDFGSWYIQSASQTRMLIYPLLRYINNWYLPKDIANVGSENKTFWQERFDEGIAKLHC